MEERGGTDTLNLCGRLTMMNLELNENEKKVLADILDSSISGLADEISHTDTRDYREFLKKRRESLERIRSKLH